MATYKFECHDKRTPGDKKKKKSKAEARFYLLSYLSLKIPAFYHIHVYGGRFRRATCTVSREIGAESILVFFIKGLTHVARAFYNLPRFNLTKSFVGT